MDGKVVRMERFLVIHGLRGHRECNSIRWVYVQQDDLVSHPAPSLSSKQYSEDPELHELFYEAIIERSSTIATLLTTSDRNAFRFQYAPFCENKTFDWQYRSGRDDAWDRWVVRAGGVEAIKDRLHLVRL